MARLLPNPVIQTVYKAAVAAQLGRDTLLAGLPPELVHNLVRADQPGAQILTDLLRLNLIEQLEDGTVPLRDWLETAELLGGPLPEAKVFREALAQLNAGKQAGAAPPHPTPRPADARANELALRGLLLGMFSADELRRFVRYRPDGSSLEAALPGPTASPAALVDAVVDVLVRRHALDREFFEALAAERPRRSGEIENVRRLFQG